MSALSVPHVPALRRTNHKLVRLCRSALEVDLKPSTRYTIGTLGSNGIEAH